MTQLVNEILKKTVLKTENIKFLQVREASGESIHSPEVLAMMMKEEAKVDRECLWVLHLNNSNRVIEKELVSMGTVNKAVVYPREIFKKAIIDGAVSIVTVHNHPGDQVQPSDDDRRLWEKLDSAGKILGVETLDHLIVTPSGRYYSKKEDGG
ncbi:MAG: JAB domain-containing protein [bacterium]